MLLNENKLFYTLVCKGAFLVKTRMKTEDISRSCFVRLPPLPKMI